MLAALADLTLRGSLVFAGLVLLDFAVRRRMRARSRRAWWWLVGLAFLVPLELLFVPGLPAPLVAARRGLSVELPLPALTATSGAHVTIEPVTIPVLPTLTWLWLVGAAGYLGVVATRTWRTQRRWARERLSTDSDLLELLEDCKAIAGVTAPIGLVLSGTVAAPALLGWIRPRILLPADLAGRLLRTRLRAILLHELAHFRAMDLALHWIFTLSCAVHWFNPVAHVAARRWLHYRELAADEAALDWLPPSEQLDYGEALIATLEHAHTLPLPCGALALGESLRNLKHRIVMISRHASLARHGLFAFAISLAVAGLLVLQSARGEDAPDKKTAVTQAITAWLGIIDAGQFEQSWKEAGELFREKVTSEQWQAQLGAVRSKLGACKSRQFASLSEQQDLPGGLKGEFVIARYDSSYEHLTNARELLTFAKEADGKWRAIGYFVRPAEAGM